MQFVAFSCAMCDFSPGNSYRYYVRVVWLRVGYGLIYSYLTHPLYPCSWGQSAANEAMETSITR
jgi:hypothetical protein